VRADYIELGSSNKTEQSAGLPQGGPLSPILSNIYLHKLDVMMEEKMEKENSNPISINSVKYRGIHSATSNLNPLFYPFGVKNNLTYGKINKRQTINRTKNEALKEDLVGQVKELEKARARLPSKSTNYQFTQLWYTRYADYFIVGVRGKKSEAVDLKTMVENFIRTELNLELNLEKTLITDAKKGRANFLGAELRVAGPRAHEAKRTMGTYKGVARKVRIPSGKMLVLAPLEKLVKKLEDQGVCRIIDFSQRVIHPKRKTA